MKTIVKFVVIFAALLFASTYALASTAVPAKYDLDNQLRNVAAMPNTNFIGFEHVDNQSFVVQTTPSNYYLIVLSFPSFNLPYVEGVRITGQNLMIRPGFDNVIIREADGYRESYIINRIYKFKDRQQVNEIVAQITGDLK